MNGARPHCQAPDPNVRTPSLTVPPGSVDTHFHVFGLESRYPFTADRSYTPPEAPLEQYRAMLDALAVERAVLVHPSVYGTDNRITLDILAACRAWMRAVAVVDESVTDRELERMHYLGVRGLRVNLLYKGGVDLELAEHLATRIAGLGWHLQLLADVSELTDLPGLVERLPVDVVIDHMGHMAASKGIDHPAFRNLLGLVREGRTWVKLSGAYRLTGEREPPYSDVKPFARALVEANPSRMLWASDWPHPLVDIPMPNDADLLDMLADWVPDEETRNRILVDNPETLYGFDN